MNRVYLGNIEVTMLVTDYTKTGLRVCDAIWEKEKDIKWPKNWKLSKSISFTDYYTQATIRFDVKGIPQQKDIDAVKKILREL